ncbi:SusC/RagA family TonB-linked outer membrane protein [Elizabethkingia anophelis]|uniref:SusC/RagA family TonB-linked outer membrane protein n=1 Tax=Elizabethkingia anophelis TaxID=1117645 RepID=UPI000CE99657|nr:TonB-dependent receptor [Elizabethkingia anophelis]AVF47618.1 SusC/RagA family TonB-linked outer membrane protein [Elizabethkingia anophelis]AVF51611.1 SusC/RagA family TonB-linked outer membrane protein [Elizabethkingia anophelis]MBG0505146.1 TonB-dependent receptor [Elizabethkingia anophelis]MCT3923609.1 TonB-dependent receptor [Elizabethkingia anophelis]MCT4063013.1 TonB-dependent receptor [Elizabethkingia anophelis]
MKQSPIRNLSLIAVLYFTANINAQQSKKDTTANEKKIEEVVVIGYGTQKKSNVTGAIASLKAKELENVPAGRPEQVLQGRASGVSVVSNSGQPGSAATIRVRGITSFGAGNDPLWIVDGIAVDNIGFLNQSDIESMEILKDGASASIYGVSAARGVILVTTKKGKQGKISLSYNGFYGVGNAAKKLDLLNASQYAMLANEKRINGGGNAYFPNPDALGAGTDWQKLIFNSAARTSHDISVSGGNDKSTFFGSFGYYNQEGIVMRDISNYKRITARLNSSHKVFPFLTVGQTLNYTHVKSQGINSNGEFGGPLSSAINLDPTTPIIETDPAKIKSSAYNNPYILRAPGGNPYGISSLVNQEMSNPLAFQQTQLGNYNWSDDFVGNVYAELKLLKDFTFKSTLNGKLSYWGNQSFTPLFYLSPTYSNTNKNSLYRETQRKFEWSTENTLNYHKKLGKHTFDALIGQGFYVYNIAEGQGTTYTGLPITSYKDASFNFSIPDTDKRTWATDGIQTKKASYFGRLIYDYDGKYLFTGTIRRDGSSKFGPNKVWGTFPAASAGWVVSKENFWPENRIVNMLKIRGGYGKTGNDAIDNFLYRATIIGGSNYPFYDGKTEFVGIGYRLKTLENRDLHWEKTAQTNIGADLKLFNDFTLGFDWFNKKTTDILRYVDLPGYIGVTDSPAANVGDMSNKGIEIELGYKKNITEDFGISVNGNFSYIKNEILRLENGKKFVSLAGFQSMGDVSRLQVGSPYGSFFGLMRNGVFQNQTEINSYVDKNGNKIQPDAKPGDFRWVDANGDGKINTDDYTYLGNSLPKFTYGLTVNLNYKNFDLMIFGQGQGGNKIFQGLRRLDMQDANYQTAALERWHGEGTSNTYARLTTNDTNKNFSYMSDFYLQKGDYFRLKLIQIGYTLPMELTKKLGGNKFRFYVTAENLFTITKYTGYDPEIAAGDSYGIDRAYYPQARTFIFGANIQF